MEDVPTASEHVRQIQDRLRHHKRKRWGGSEITLWCLQTALCISCIQNYNFDSGVAWLTSKERRGAPVPSDATIDELKSLLEEAFLQLPQDELMSWVDPATSSLPATVIKTALAYAQGHCLASWVRDKNVSTGFVVRTERLIERYNDMNSSGPSANQFLADVRPVTHQNGRKWAQRWRQKHSAFVGSLRVREPVDADEIRQKVRWHVPGALNSLCPIPATSRWRLKWSPGWKLRSFLMPQVRFCGPGGVRFFRIEIVCEGCLLGPEMCVLFVRLY